MSPLESERNKQLSRLSYLNHPQQNKIVQQKQMMIENNFYKFASNAGPVAVAEANITDEPRERERENGKEAEETNVREERTEPTNGVSGAAIEGFAVKNNNNSSFNLNAADVGQSNVRQDGFKLNGAGEIADGPEPNGKSEENRTVGASQNVEVNFSSTSIRNNRNDEIASSLNGSSVDLNQGRRFSIRRPSRLLNEDNDFVSEKISDIYVNRNVNNFYTNFDNSNEYARRNAANHHGKGFFLHNGPSNGQKMVNAAEPKVYHVFTKQQSREAIAEKQRLNEDNEYLATKFAQASSSVAAKPMQRARDTKRSSIVADTWASFEEDELTNILG